MIHGGQQGRCEDYEHCKQEMEWVAATKEGGRHRAFLYLGLLLRPVPLVSQLPHQPPSQLPIRPHHTPILSRALTARLPQRIPSRNALSDDARAQRRKGIRPGQVRSGIPADGIGVPLQTQLSGRETTAAAHNGLNGEAMRRHDMGAEEQVRQVRERVADGGHLPVENANHARLRDVVDQVVDLVVAVDQAGAVGRLSAPVLEEGDEGVEVRDRADGDAGGEVGCERLRGGDRAQGL